MSKKRRVAATSNVERVSPDELHYLQVVTQQAQQAELVRINYARYLGERYKVLPEDQFDILTGIITRVSTNGG